MPRQERKQLFVLMALHMLWGLILWFSISKYGLGVSSDSNAYMFTGVYWIRGNGLIDYSGAQYILWPPLYPMLIGFLHITGLNAFAAAHVIQFTAFALIAYFSSIFLLKIFDEDVRGSPEAAISTVIIIIFLYSFTHIMYWQKIHEFPDS